MRALVALAALLALCPLCHADGAVPLVRPSTPGEVAVRMYVGSDRSLVRETCKVFLPAGQTEVQFRWTDAAIDAGSVTLQAPPEVQVGGLRQVASDGKTLVWPVTTPAAGVYSFTACYFITGLKWSASYYLTFDAVAGTATLSGKLHLSNDSRLPLRRVRLELSCAPTGALEPLAGTEASQSTYAAFADCTLEPGWQRRLGFLQVRDIPCKVVYRADAETFKQEVRRFLLVDLTRLPTPAVLPKGHLEVYESLGERRVPVVGTDLVQVTDLDTEIQLGVERDIVYERKVTNRRKTDIEFDRLGRVSGFDSREEVVDTLRNHRAGVVKLELIEKIGGKWDLATRTVPSKKEANEVKWEFELGPAAQAEVAFTVIRRTGTRAD